LNNYKIFTKLRRAVALILPRFISEMTNLSAPPNHTAQTRRQMGRYLVGAVIALVLDYWVVWGALWFGAHAWFARALGLLVGVSTTYFFNRRYTFTTSAKPTIYEWLRYFAIQLVGSALNFTVSTVALYWGDRSTLHVALAIGAGAVIGFCYNFFAARRVLQQR
jgi:putative flippase GtrA